MLKIQRRKFKHLSAILTLAVFSFSNFNAVPRAAAYDEATISDNVNKLSLFSKLSPSLGQIKETSVQSSENPAIIHIQDAHAVPSAQRKIQDILRWISQEEKNKKIIVGLEGASGEIHPEYLELIKGNAKVNDAVVTDLWEKGEITGADLFAWELYKRGGEERGRVQFVGIETPELYRKNLLSYRSLLYKQSEILDNLNIIHSSLDIVKSLHFTPELMEFVREKERRKEGRFDLFRQDIESEIHLDGYMRYLVDKANQLLKIDLKDPIEQLRFPNLSHLFSLDEIQKSLDSQKASAEKENLLQQLQRVNKQELAGKVKNLENSATPRVSIENLYETAPKAGIDLKKYPEYFRQAAGIVLKAELNPEELFTEIGTLENLIFSKMAQTENQKKVLALIDRYTSLEKLLLLKLSREEFSKLNQDITRIAPATILKEAESLGGKSAGNVMLGEDFEDAIGFYTTAALRDQALLDNLLKNGTSESVKILISGGFHTDGLTALMRDKQLGYAVIMPAFSTENSKGLSAKVFKDENADLSNYFTSQPPDKQSRLILKELIDVALPQLSRESKQNLPEQKLIEEAIANNPVLSGAVSVAKNADLNRFSPAAMLKINTVGDTDIMLAPQTYRALRAPISPRRTLESTLTIRPELRMVDVTEPKVYFSQFLASQFYGQRDRKFNAFLPPEGKISIVLKIGGKKIAAKILLPDGSFAEKEIYEEPIYAQRLGIDPGHVSRKEFANAMQTYAEEGQKKETAARKELERLTIDQMARQISELIEWAQQTYAEQFPDIFSAIHTIGITSHGPFTKDTTFSGIFNENPAVLPFFRKTSIKHAIKGRLAAHFPIQNIHDVSVTVLDDMSAAGAGEISKNGSFPGENKAMYISWGSRIAASLYINGKPFRQFKKAPEDFGEIGQEMYWIPETRSYEWMGRRVKLPSAKRGRFLSQYKNGNEHYGSENTAAYFGTDDFRNLRPEQVIRAGWDFGRMIASYLKAISAEYGPGVVPQKIVLGSVVPEDLGLYNPYLIDAIREGFYAELHREPHEELGYIHGLVGKHDNLLLNVKSENVHDQKKELEQKLIKAYGRFYATNYMRAFEEKKSERLEEQAKKSLSVKRRQMEAMHNLTVLPAETDLRKLTVKAKLHIKHYEYIAAEEAIEQALALLDPNDAVDAERKNQYLSALNTVRSLHQENIEAGKILEGRLGKDENLPFNEWKSPALYGGPGFNQQEWNQVMETWMEFGHQAQEDREVEVGRDVGAGSTAAKKSVRLLMSNREEIARLKARGIDVRVGPWAGPHFVKSRLDGTWTMHVGYVGSDFSDTIKSLLPEGITMKKDPNHPNVLIFSGGSGAPGLHVPILHKLKQELDPLFKIAVLLTNTDDGGSSWKLVEALIRNGYGIYPPFGDIVNALFNSFLPPEMLANILDDGGRLANNDKKDDPNNNQYELHQSVRESVKGRIAKAKVTFGISEGHPLYERFNNFETKILHWMTLVDEEFFNESNPILKKKGASIRNLVLLGALLESGTLKKQVPGDQPNALYEKAAQEKFQETLAAVAAGVGVKDATLSVSSFDDATLWAVYEENVILFKDQNGSDVAIAVKKNQDGTVSVRNPLKQRAPVQTLNEGNTLSLSGITLGNEKGEPYISKNNQKWFIEEDTTQWKTYLHNRESGKKIEIFNDGSGRPAIIGRKFEKNEPKGDAEKAQAKQGVFIGDQNGVEVYVRSRFIVRQTNATETANFSKIVDIGAINFMGEKSLQDLNPPVEGKAQHANPEAVKLIENTTDLILMGPGSLHTSLMPHLLSHGIIKALMDKKGKVKRAFVFNPNRDNETIGMSVEEIIEFIERIATRTISSLPEYENVTVKFEDIFDTILVNNGVAPAEQWKEALLARHEIRNLETPLVDRLGLNRISTSALHQTFAAYPHTGTFTPRTELFLGAAHLLSGSETGYYDDPASRASAQSGEAAQKALLSEMFVSADEAASINASKNISSLSQAEREAFVKAYSILFQSGGKVVLPAQALAILTPDELRQYVDLIMEGLAQSGTSLKSPAVIIAGSQNPSITPAIRETIQQATLSSAALRKVFTLKPLEEGFVANQYSKDAVSVSLANPETENLPDGSIPTYVLDLPTLSSMKDSVKRVKYLTSMTQLQFLTAEEITQQANAAAAEVSEGIQRLLNRIGVEFSNSAGGYLMPKVDSLLEGQVAEFIATRKAEISA